MDEERYPPVYENAEIKAWRERNLVAQQLLRANSVEFHRHYIGSTACCPSRATLMTGQYPSLHGVSQTPGIAKNVFDSDMFWLDRNTVPTMGDYFRAAGYQTHYRGKWHVSYEDIVIPGTHGGLLSYDPHTGVPDRRGEQLYARADRLDDFGFSGWIGPEPQGRNPRNSGSSASTGLSGRDEVYAAEVIALIEALGRQHKQDEEAKPWLVVSSFVNPHDIALYGALSARIPAFRFAVESSMPEVSPPPTIYENLFTKPRCQASYRDLYPKALQPIIDAPFYRKLYYQLQKNADQQMLRVYQALTRSPCYDNTIVIFTSDHGDLLNAHGNLHQKWYCAYEEFLHVPFLIHNRQLFPRHHDYNSLTSHVDLLPTMLGLANADITDITSRLQSQYSEARTLVGRNLAPVILRQQPSPRMDEPLYFMTDDDPTRGQHQTNPLGVPYSSVIQPNHIETVLATRIEQGRTTLWKYSRYFDNPQFRSQPSAKDASTVPDEYELYNITDDPLEISNLAHPALATPYTRTIEQWMRGLLEEQRKVKRLYPVGAR